MKDIINALWQFLNIPFDFGDVTFKFIYLVYLSCSLALLKKIFFGGAKVD